MPQLKLLAVLSEIVDDVAENRLDGDEGGDPVEVYGVNIVLEHEEDHACPIVVEGTRRC